MSSVEIDLAFSRYTVHLSNVLCIVRTKKKRRRRMRSVLGLFLQHTSPSTWRYAWRMLPFRSRVRAVITSVCVCTYRPCCHYQCLCVPPARYAICAHIGGPSAGDPPAALPRLSARGLRAGRRPGAAPAAAPALAAAAAAASRPGMRPPPHCTEFSGSRRPQSFPAASRSGQTLHRRVSRRPVNRVLLANVT